MSTIWVSSTSRLSRISSPASVSTVELKANFSGSSAHEHDAGVLELLHPGSGYQQVRCAIATDQERLDQGRAVLFAQSDGQVGEAADDPVVRAPHLLAGQPAEQQHVRSMPE